jgi:hypothetical protein
MRCNAITTPADSIQKIHPSSNQRKIPAQMTIPATFSTATVSPCLAILVSRLALPFKFVEREEKTWFYYSAGMISTPSFTQTEDNGLSHRVVKRVLVPSIIIDIDRDIF